MSLSEIQRILGERASEHAPFGARTTYRVGGTARLVIEVGDLDQLVWLSPLLAEVDCPVVTLGKGSNTLVADGEFDGIVLILADGFTSLAWRDEGEDVIVTAGAALGLPIAARRLADAGVTGFEWAVGIPGSFGGAAVMNAGGHGSDMAASVRSVDVLTIGRTSVDEWTRERLDFDYRHSALGPSDIVVSVTLELQRGDAEASRERVREIVRWRREHQPGGSNAGSVFRNPQGTSAGALIDAAGLKGRREGSATVSEKHANFIQVDDGGSADDVNRLMKEVRREVAARSGISLESEIRRVGFSEADA